VQLVNLIRINTGGPAQNFGGEVWVADQYFTGGSLYSTAAAISNTTQDQIYQSERWGNMQYSIPVPAPGLYAVDLHFAEIYFNATGARVFNISIENNQFTRTNLDLIAEYGQNNEANVMRADNITVNDGVLNITFTSVVNNAKISGIAVGQYVTSGARSQFAGTPPVVKTPKNVTIYEGQAWSYQVEASDPDGDKLTYATKGLPASLYIDKATGFIKGTIEVNANTFPVTVKVSDATGLTTDVNFVITIAARPILPEVQTEQQFVVYPNPVDKNEFSVRLEVKERGQWNFSLLDFTGKQIQLGRFELEEGFQEVLFDLHKYNLSAGLYYLSVQNGNGKKVVKIGIKN
jgi:hypothetical protein